MTKKQFDDLYLGKVVHCETEEKAKAFLSLAKSFGYTWASGADLEEYIRWNTNEENTCYRFSNNGVVTDHKSYYINNSYEVVEFKQEKENEMKKYVIARKTENSKLVYYTGDYEFYTNELRFFDSLVEASMVLVDIARNEALSKLPPQDFIIKEVDL